MLVGPRKYQKKIIKIELKRVKNPNWPEANQLAIYKQGRGFELGTTVNNSSYRSERELNSGPPNCKSGALTARPRCLLLKRRKTLETFHGLLISEKVVLGSVSQVYCLAMQNLCNFETIRSLLFFYVLFADGAVKDRRSNTSIEKQFRNYKVLHCQAIYLTYKTQRHFLTNQESVKCFQCFAPLDNDCVHYSNSDWLIEPQDCVVIGLSASNICFAQQREIGETGNEKVKKRRQLFTCITLFPNISLQSLTEHRQHTIFFLSRSWISGAKKFNSRKILANISQTEEGGMTFSHHP